MIEFSCSTRTQILWCMRSSWIICMLNWRLQGKKGGFDFSNFPTDHPLHNDSNKCISGLLKDECNVRPIKEFVDLRSKMYSLFIEGGDVKVVKGVKKSMINNDLKFSNYKECLVEEETMEHSFWCIQSNQHSVHTLDLKKNTLSGFDDKRCREKRVVLTFQISQRITLYIMIVINVSLACSKMSAMFEPIKEFVDLRSKMYSLSIEGGDVKVVKGVKKSMINNDLKFSNYKECLVEEETMEHSFWCIQSNQHSVHTLDLKKNTLSGFDDKRFLLNMIDSVSTKNELRGD